MPCEMRKKKRDIQTFKRIFVLLFGVFGCHNAQ